MAVDKVIEGKYQFLAHLNPARFNKRPTEFKMDKVAQPFDEAKFNFTKAVPEESLFQMHVVASGPRVTVDAEAKPLQDTSTDVLMINISPIGMHHILLLPSFLEKLPQQMTATGLQRAVELLHLIDHTHFRIGFNSFGAYASVNHLHFQVHIIYIYIYA